MPLADALLPTPALPEEATVSQLIDHIGLGKAQYASLLFVGLGCYGVQGAFWITHLVYLSNSTLKHDLNISKEMFPVSDSVFFLGWAFGVYLWCQLADAVGRQRVIVGLLLLGAATAWLCTLCTSMIPFFALRCLLGFTTGGLGAVGYILIIEVARTNDRGPATVLLSFFYSIGLMLLAGISKLLQHTSWQRQILLLEVAPALVLALLNWLFVLESPRWALTARGPEAGMQLIRRLAAVNGCTLPQGRVTLLATDSRSNSESSATAGSETRVSVSSSSSSNSTSALGKLRILLTGEYGFHTIVMAYCWLAVTFIYYGLTFQASAMWGDLYTNGALLALAELPAQVMVYFSVDRKGVGRRGTQASGFALAAAALLTIALPGLSNEMSIALAMVGKVGATAAFVVVYVFAGELFPTVLRASALGLCNFGSRIGGVLAPLMMHFSIEAALVVFGIMSAVGCWATLLLPETLGKELQDHVVSTEAGEATGSVTDKGVLGGADTGRDYRTL